MGKFKRVKGAVRSRYVRSRSHASKLLGHSYMTKVQRRALDKRVKDTMTLNYARLSYAETFYAAHRAQAVAFEQLPATEKQEKGKKRLKLDPTPPRVAKLIFEEGVKAGLYCGRTRARGSGPSPSRSRSGPARTA